jgi:hypothetical protein
LTRLESLNLTIGPGHPDYIFPRILWWDPDAVKQMPFLHTLILRGNQVFPADLLIGMTQLTHLDLSALELGEKELSVLTGLTRLTRLTLGQ